MQHYSQPAEISGLEVRVLPGSPLIPKHLVTLFHGHIHGEFGQNGNHFNVAAAGQQLFNLLNCFRGEIP